MTSELPERGRLCCKCREKSPGPGGIICPDCKVAIEARIYPSRNPVLAEELDRAISEGGVGHAGTA